LAGYQEPLERNLARERIAVIINALSCGIILAYLIIASDPLLLAYAPFPVIPVLLHVSAFACGFALAMTLDRVGLILYAAGLMALVSAFVFGAVLIAAGLVNIASNRDIVMLVAFQQALPRLLLIWLLGTMGGLAGIEVKRFALRLS
jgi:hypothetical protein